MFILLSTVIDQPHCDCLHFLCAYFAFKRNEMMKQAETGSQICVASNTVPTGLGLNVEKARVEK